jgi:hypothetical protein
MKCWGAEKLQPGSLGAFGRNVDPFLQLVPFIDSFRGFESAQGRTTSHHDWRDQLAAASDRCRCQENPLCLQPHGSTANFGRGTWHKHFPPSLLTSKRTQVIYLLTSRVLVPGIDNFSPSDISWQLRDIGLLTQKSRTLLSSLPPRQFASTINIGTAKYNTDRMEARTYHY